MSRNAAGAATIGGCCQPIQAIHRIGVLSASTAMPTAASVPPPPTWPRLSASASAVKGGIKMDKMGEINACKMLLADTDYQAIKHSEGAMTDEEFEPIRIKREAWRERVRELEAKEGNE